MAPKAMDQLDAIIDFEAGELDEDSTIDLFCNLIKTKLAWSLQGCYGRTAARFIENGIISRDGVRLA